ncbi:MAG: uroporphyrinogen decarboxylase family protein [Ruminococcus sp.]
MGKELIFQALRHEKLDKIPWVPFAGVHAGKLKGYSAKELLTDEDKLYDSLMEVHKLYMPDGMPIMFDLQLEAEILGCDLLWAEFNPPSVTSHPCEDGHIPSDDQIPKATEGRIPMVLNTMKRVKASVDDTALYGLLCGPLTLASHLRGSDFFMDMFNNKQLVEDLMTFCTKVAIQMADYYIDAGMDVIAVVDPLVSQVSPKFFAKLMGAHFTKVFDHIRERGKFSAFFVCGNATKQIGVMCDTHPDSIHVDENVNLANAKQTTDEYNILLGGNIPLTTTMLFGTQQDNMKCVVDLIDSIDHSQNFILSPGCDMPYDCPIENTIAVAQTAKNPEEVREMVKNYTAVEDDLDSVEIPDYVNRDKVLIELFTLDPEQCAACTYMVAAVVDNFDAIQDMAEYVIYQYNRKEDIARTKKMGVANLPTMCISGEQKYISIIPSKEELVAAVKEAYGKLNR